MRYLGCAYYPEYWGPERLEADAKLMRECGIDVVRIAEFAWSRLEPEEGVFTFDWLHHACEVMHQHGIRVLLCTPTAAPPAWLTRRYPEVLLQRNDGTRMQHGGRRHYCPTSAVYRQHCERITLALAEATARHPNLLGWQVDNELGPESGRCYCDSCQVAFRGWLKQRYGSIAGLNRAWATGFWSEDYFDWSEVRFHLDRPSVAPSRGLDMLRFHSEAWVAFAIHQRDLIRRHQPRSLVTTNGMGGPVHPPIDHWRLFGDEFDVACNDLYHDCGPIANSCAAHDIFRSYKPGRGHWLTETGSGALDHGKPPTADQFRAWVWSGIAHGADAWMIFRWRTCLSGQEQELQGILEHSGHPGHRFRAVKHVFGEVRGLMPDLQALPQPDAPVAILHDYDSHWLYEASRVGIDVKACSMPVYRQFWSRGIGVQYVRPGQRPDGARLLVLKNQPSVSPALAQMITSFLAAGGVVLAIGQLGLRDDNGTYLPEPGPGGLSELAGVSCVGGMYLVGGVNPEYDLANRERTVVPIRGRLGGKPLSGTAQMWMADLQPTTATVLARFTDEAYAGQPALTEHRVGPGRFLWLATSEPDEALLGRVAAYALAAANVGPVRTLPTHVEVVRRGDWLFAINHAAKPATVDLGVTGRVILGTVRGKRATLPPYGVAVIATTRAGSASAGKKPR